MRIGRSLMYLVGPIGPIPDANAWAKVLARAAQAAYIQGRLLRDFGWCSISPYSFVDHRGNWTIPYEELIENGYECIERADAVCMCFDYQQSVGAQLELAYARQLQRTTYVWRYDSLLQFGAVSVAPKETTNAN